MWRVAVPFLHFEVGVTAGLAGLLGARSIFCYNVDSCRLAMQEEATKYVRPGRPWQVLGLSKCERWLVPEHLLGLSQLD